LVGFSESACPRCPGTPGLRRLAARQHRAAVTSVSRGEGCWASSVAFWGACVGPWRSHGHGTHASSGIQVHGGRWLRWRRAPARNAARRPGKGCRVSRDFGVPTDGSSAMAGSSGVAGPSKVVALTGWAQVVQTKQGDGAAMTARGGASSWWLRAARCRQRRSS
jgi:hypothetical protein